LSTLSVVGAFLSRDFRINISYRASFALQTLATVFQLALFYFLSRVVDEAEFTGQGLTGGYFAYAAVGLVVLTIVQVSVGSFALKLREEQMTGTFEALVATPISPSLMVLSSAVYDLIRATVSGLVLLGAAVAIFGLRLDLNPASIGTAVAALVGCLGLFASLGVAVAALTVVFKRMTGLVGMLFALLGLLAGVYFPIEVLPAPLERVANALPLTWGLDVLRASLLGGEVDAGQLGGLFVSGALLLPVALLGFSAAVRRARQTGTLGQY
jgi:ABC-2 type transport system permease protein